MIVYSIMNDLKFLCGGNEVDESVNKVD
ncbi:hypothetical protein MTBBW1_520012 [Desulfamplus magnetovallimortis]|uniref:Uncharacterized protein n=1 Tax=Desulfamplus magnetovallimortis TaxID=1246637 RepID=A0A1W1HHT7_9BACT|nr:hypothetical protein MTBBW1_520012 [Desulfamplus magnetovallimortis]